MDEDRDGLVSLEEFMKYTSNKVFDTNDEWKPVRDHPEEVFTEQVSVCRGDEHCLKVNLNVGMVWVGFIRNWSSLRSTMQIMRQIMMVS